MSISSERIKQDILKLEEFSKTINGRVKIKSTQGNPITSLLIELDYPTAFSNTYPQEVQKKTEVEIIFKSRYPFEEPVAKIRTPILHPNVYASGLICLGTKWLPTQGLDLLVKKIIQIITFDEAILNVNSPANSSALAWYRSAKIKYPNSFPTDKLSIAQQNKTISWTNVRG